MELLTRATTGAFGKMTFVVPAHLRGDAGDVISPACQNCAYDPVGALDSRCRHRQSPAKNSVQPPSFRVEDRYGSLFIGRSDACSVAQHPRIDSVAHSTRCHAPAHRASSFCGRCLAYHCNSFFLKTDSGKRFMLRGEQQAVGQKAGPVPQCPFRSDPRQLRKIIVFRKMAKNNVGGLAVVVGG